MNRDNRLWPPWISAFSGLRFLSIIFLCHHHFGVFNNLQMPGWSEVIPFSFCLQSCSTAGCVGSGSAICNSSLYRDSDRRSVMYCEY